jgi:glycosyltransferase involved in cell wall biosynthesis
MSSPYKTIGVIVTKERKHGVNKFAKEIVRYAFESSSKYNIRCIELEIDELFKNDNYKRCDAYFINITPTLFKRGNKELFEKILLLKRAGILSKSVITLHDLYYTSNDKLKKEIISIPSVFNKEKIKKTLIILKRRLYKSYYIKSLRMIILNAKYIVVNSDGEKDRILDFLCEQKLKEKIDKIRKIPHFIKEMPSYSPELALECKRKLALKFGLDPEKKLITILGYIHQRKNQIIAPRLLYALNGKYQILLAGMADSKNEEYLQNIINEAKELSTVSDLKITGFLSEEDYVDVLYATDIALAPYIEISASGSLSDWVSVNAPIICYENQLTAEYYKKWPSKIKLCQDKVSINSVAEKVYSTSIRNTKNSHHLGDYSMSAVCQKYISLWELCFD